MSEPDFDFEKVDAALRILGEHFDSVHIFCTRHETGTDDGTIQINSGVGNWYARYGQVKDWMIRQDERTRLNIRKKEEAE